MPMPRDVFHLSDEQFNKIVELLTPGWELSKAYLAEYQAKLAEAQAPAAETSQDASSQDSTS